MSLEFLGSKLALHIGQCYPRAFSVCKPNVGCSSPKLTSGEFKGNNFCCHSWISVSSPMCLSEEWCLIAKFNRGVLWLFPFERTSYCLFLSPKTHQLCAWNPPGCWKWKPFLCPVSPEAAHQPFRQMHTLKGVSSPFICTLHWGFCVHSGVTLMYLNKHPPPTRKVTQSVFGAAGFCSVPVPILSEVTQACTCCTYNSPCSWHNPQDYHYSAPGIQSMAFSLCF